MSSPRPHRSILRLGRRGVARRLAALGVVLIVSGCGQKGPLYLPDEADPEGGKKKDAVSAAPGARATS